MDSDLVDRIVASPSYQELKHQRTRLGWWLALAMMVVYYGFILLVAFDKPLLASLVAPGLSLGIALGAAVIERPAA